MEHRCEEIDIDQLISAVEDRPELWDKTSDAFKDRNNTKKAWDEVCNILFENYYLEEDKIKTEKCTMAIKKWTNVRDSFIKSHKKLKTLKSGAACKKMRKYIFYDQLTFLTKTIEHGDTHSSLPADADTSEKLDGEDSSDSFVQSPMLMHTTSSVASTSSQSSTATRPSASTVSQLSTSTAKPKVTRKDKRSDFENKLLHLLENTPSVPQINEDKLFLESLLPTLEKFNDEQKLEFRLRVLNVVKEIKYSSVQHHSPWPTQYIISQQSQYNPQLPQQVQSHIQQQSSRYTSVSQPHISPHFQNQDSRVSISQRSYYEQSSEYEPVLQPLTSPDISEQDSEQPSPQQQMPIEQQPNFLYE